MKYAHISKVERYEISILLKKGYSMRDIARTLGRSPSSVSREIVKNSVNEGYHPAKAYYKAYVRRRYAKYQGMKIREHLGLEKYIEEKMKLSWSPEQIAGRWKRDTGQVIHYTSIYKYLYSAYGQGLCQHLRYKRYKRKKRIRIKSPREIIKNRVFIENRPEIINQRERYGDFEGDTLGTPRGSNETLAGMIERKSRYILAQKIARIREAMDAFGRTLIPLGALSFTLDNGVENVRYQELGIPTYFCHPYSSWEKGSVEYAFKLIREYIPKKARIEEYTDQEIRAIVDTINNRPRKCLGWRTAKEVFEEHFLKQKSSLSLTTSVALQGRM